MKYEVTAVYFDLTKSPRTASPERTETIDTATNALFKDCVTLQDVEIVYEQFWNYLNDGDVVHNPKEKIKVLEVKRLGH